MSVLSFLRRQFRPARQMPPGVVEKSGPAPQPRREISLAEISDGGERMTHLYPNDCYFAHLSIYDFALPWTTGKVVLDAPASELLADDDVREFYLGLHPEGTAKSFRDVKHYKRRKRWLS